MRCALSRIAPAFTHALIAVQARPDLEKVLAVKHESGELELDFTIEPYDTAAVVRIDLVIDIVETGPQAEVFPWTILNRDEGIGQSARIVVVLEIEKIDIHLEPPIL